MKKKIQNKTCKRLLHIVFFMVLNFSAFAQSNGDYRSKGSGNWANNITYTVTRTSNVITAITITGSPSGFDDVNPPSIVISGGSGTGATATAVVSGGKVTTITVTNGGTGYTANPTIAVAVNANFPTLPASIWEKYNSSTSTWDNVAFGTSTSGSINVTIKSGHTVTISTLSNVNKLVVESGAILNGWVSSSLRFISDIVNNGSIGGTNAADRFNLTYSNVVTLPVGAPAPVSATISGTGTCLILGLNTLAELVNATLYIDQDMNVTNNINAIYGNSANQDVNNITFVVNAGKTVVAKALHSSGTTATIGNFPKYGKYSYVINGTLDMSASTTTSCFAPYEAAGSTDPTVTLTVNGTLKLGRSFRAITTTAGTPEVGKVYLNINDGGIVDATMSTTLFDTGSKYFITTGSGVLKRTVGATDVKFPVGTAGSTTANPIILNNSGTSGNFSVSVKNALDVPFDKAINKQWTVNAETAGANLTVKTQWLSADNGTFNASDSPFSLINKTNVGSSWASRVAAVVTGNGTSGTPYIASASGITSFGAFSVMSYNPTSWSGTAWSSFIPDATLEAFIDGTYSTTANGTISAKKLTVNGGKSLTINTGTNLTVQNEVINNGSLVVENNANLIQVNNTTNTGNVVVKRNSSPLLRLDYTLWSSPVAGQNLAAFSPLTSQSPSRFYAYNSTTNLYSTIASPTTTNFTTGTGCLIRMPNTADAVTPTAFVGQFTGVPNNGDLSFTLSTAGGGYNLVGNPYPSPIIMATLVTDNSTVISTTLYLWRKTNGAGSAYCTYNTTGSIFTTNGNANSVNPAGVIQTGQGFFVQAIAAGSLVFKNGQRAANTAGQFFKTKQVATPSRIWLNATNTAGDFSQMAVNYTEGATQGVDDFDGKYINDSPLALTSNINNEDYVIQGRPAFDASDVVALNFKTSVAGDYTIAIDHTDGVFATGQDVFLKDNTTGTETDLKAGVYTFKAAAGVDNSRFALKYQRNLGVNVVAFNNNSITVSKNKGTLNVNSGGSTISNIKVYDVQGRLLAELKNVKSTSASISNLSAANQVLVVKITSQDDKVVTKKVVN